MDPIRKTLTIPLPPADAFHLFTHGIDTWWPKDSHSLSANDGDLPQKIDIEPKKGGKITETKPDGTKAPWGRVTRWDPARAFGMDWHVGRPADQATQVLVVFSQVEAGTRIELTHSGFENLTTNAIATHAGYQTGWDYVLGQCYLDRAKARVSIPM